MRFPAAFLLAAALGLAAGAPAWAEPPEPPLWSVENVMPPEEQAPAGWRIRSVDEGPGGLGYAALEALGTELGLDEDVFYVEFRVFEGDAGRCGVAMLDADRDAEKVLAALEARGAEHGWSVRALGTPMRLVVVSGEAEPRTALLRTLLGEAVYTFCDLARRRLNTARGRGDPHAAVEEYIRVIRALEPEAGVGFSLAASLSVQRGAKDPQNPDWIEWDEAIAALRRALAPATPFPPRGGHRYWAATRLGMLLVDKERADVLAEAVAALREAVAIESDAPDAAARVDARVWLCRALARQGPTPEAFTELRGTLEMARTLLPPGSYKAVYEQVKEKDKHFGGLRGDSRFAALMGEFAPPEPKKPAGHPAPEKQQAGRA